MTKLIDDIQSKSWRMNNLYCIIDKSGNSIRFNLNKVQQHVLENIHTRNLILKARQLGMSTFSVIYLLDECLWNPNFSAGIVSYSLEHAQHIFKKIIGHALSSFPSKLKHLLNIQTQSAREITFGNGSSLRVDTSLRGGSYQLVLVSEFGKTCARSPMKSEEIVTGTLNTVSQSGTIIIESTGEGQEGYFAEMVLSSSTQTEELTPLDYKLFFFPWYEEEGYIQNKQSYWDVELEDYFTELSNEIGVQFSQQQKNWYGAQYKLLGAKIKQEYPSTIKESFVYSSDAYYFAAEIETAYSENRMLSISPYDPLEKVFVSFDIGLNDATVIIYFQLIHGEIRIIDYYADTDKGIDFYCHHLLNRSYIYHTLFLPHDAVKRDAITGTNSVERQVRKMFADTKTQVKVLPKLDKQLQIAQAKQKLKRCVFNVSKCKDLINHLSKYRRKWSEQYGKFLDEPLHDSHSDYADSLIYALMAVDHVSAVTDRSRAFDMHKKAVQSRTKII